MIDARSSLRASLRQTRSNISFEQQQRAAHALALRCASILTSGNYTHVAGYFAIGGEIAVDDILNGVRQRGGVSYAPILSEGSTLQFAPFDDATPMINNRFNIREPDTDISNYRMPEELDAVLVPLVGFDESCNRMGMGGGFYDRSFAHRRDQSGSPLLIGVAYDVQQAKSVFPDWWDVRLDMIVTESRQIPR